VSWCNTSSSCVAMADPFPPIVLADQARLVSQAGDVNVQL
jgi:hypothetical protein